MTARLVVVAVFALAAVAAGDALKELGSEERARKGSGETLPRLYAGPTRGYEAVGRGLFRTRVLRSGLEYLGAEAIERAFPGESDDPIDVSKVAVAPDGTLVLGVYRFHPGESAEGAIELWKGRRLVSAFLVPPGDFGGGLAFNRDATVIATLSHDGRIRGLYDRRGRRLSGIPDSFS
jgi:hypothetical protein